MKPKGVDWDWQPLGELPDPVIAARLGVTAQAVAQARKRRRIPALRARRADRELARAVMDACPRARPDVLPIRHFALLLFLGDGASTIGEIRSGLGVGQATASELVTSAEAAGRVARHAGADARHTFVSLTARGHREMARRRKPRRPGGRREIALDDRSDER